MSRNGLLIEYAYCTGCHSCEVACQQEHRYPAGTFGIVVTEHVLENLNGLSIYYLPFPTDLCNLCEHRAKDGKKPACVKHCQSGCMHFGPIDQLTLEMQKRNKTVLYSPD